jgi:hypothetical protein
MVSGIEVVILLCQQISSCGKVKYQKKKDTYKIYCDNIEIFKINGYKVLVKNSDFTNNYFMNHFYNETIIENEEYFLIYNIYNKKILCNITKGILNENYIKKPQ